MLDRQSNASIMLKGQSAGKNGMAGGPKNGAAPAKKLVIKPLKCTASKSCLHKCVPCLTDLSTRSQAQATSGFRKHYLGKTQWCSISCSQQARCFGQSRRAVQGKLITCIQPCVRRASPLSRHMNADNNDCVGSRGYVPAQNGR